jgi:hypothetical protein
MMAVLTEAERDVIEAAIWDLRSFMHREAEKYYENVIFSPRFPGDTPEDKFSALWGEETNETIRGLEKMIYGDA